MRSPRIRSLTPLATVSTSGSSGTDGYLRRDQLWLVGALSLEVGEHGVIFIQQGEGGAVDAEAGGVTESLYEGLLTRHGVTWARHHGTGHLGEAEGRTI